MKSIKLKPIFQNQLFINPNKLINFVFKMTAVFFLALPQWQGKFYFWPIFKLPVCFHWHFNNQKVLKFNIPGSRNSWVSVGPPYVKG